MLIVDAAAGPAVIVGVGIVNGDRDETRTDVAGAGLPCNRRDAADGRRRDSESTSASGSSAIRSLHALRRRTDHVARFDFEHGAGPMTWGRRSRCCLDSCCRPLHVIDHHRVKPARRDRVVAGCRPLSDDSGRDRRRRAHRLRRESAPGPSRSRSRRSYTAFFVVALKRVVFAPARGATSSRCSSHLSGMANGFTQSVESPNNASAVAVARTPWSSTPTSCAEERRQRTAARAWLRNTSTRMQELVPAPGDPGGHTGKVTSPGATSGAPPHLVHAGHVSALCRAEA